MEGKKDADGIIFQLFMKIFTIKPLMVQIND